MNIRQTQDNDLPAICDVHQRAFGADEGPSIVSLLHDLIPDPTAQPMLSLLAEEEQLVLGHVLFTNVLVAGSEADLSSRILAPLAVIPAAQKRGIGSRLVQAGLDRLREEGVGLVFVLGDPAYYTRFGFQPAGAAGLNAPQPIPAEHADAWMVRELESGQIGRVAGEVRCSEVLGRREYWLE